MITRHARAVVIGAGPAGLTAASALAARGVAPLLIVDRDDEAGGLPRFCKHLGFGWEYSHRLETGPAFVRRLVRALPFGTELLTQTTALAVSEGPEVELIGRACGHVRVHAEAVILATGIRERPRGARLVPGRRPECGVLTTGQLQQMVARGVPVRGRRAVVVGTEHVAFSILLTARHAGLQVIAMVEAGDRVMSYGCVGWGAQHLLGVPIHLGTRVEEIHGSDVVESVTLTGPAGQFDIPCDTVIFSGDFVPDAPLAQTSGLAIDSRTGGPVVDQFGRTTLRGVFAAGNVLRAVETSGIVAREGANVGGAAAAHMRGLLHWSKEQVPIGLSAAVSYLVPQHWDVLGSNGTARLPISLRAAADVARARVVLSENGYGVWASDPRRVLRHRRITMPAAAFEKLRGSQAIKLDVDTMLR